MILNMYYLLIMKNNRNYYMEFKARNCKFIITKSVGEIIIQTNLLKIILNSSEINTPGILYLD